MADNSADLLMRSVRRQYDKAAGRECAQYNFVAKASRSSLGAGGEDVVFETSLREWALLTQGLSHVVAVPHPSTGQRPRLTRGVKCVTRAVPSLDQSSLLFLVRQGPPSNQNCECLAHRAQARRSISQ